METGDESHTPGRAHLGPVEYLASGSCCLPGTLNGSGPRIRPHDEEDNLGGDGNLSLLQINSTPSPAGADFPKRTQALSFTHHAYLQGLAVDL